MAIARALEKVATGANYGASAPAPQEFFANTGLMGARGATQDSAASAWYAAAVFDNRAEAGCLP
jgi:hypothetical protein